MRINWPMDSAIEKMLMALADGMIRRTAAREPTVAQWKKCRLVAHRGDLDNGRLTENSLSAFDHALAAGVWGVELDLRWTRDRHPVVFHDPDLSRIYQSPVAVADIGLAELRRRFPGIPTLAEVVRRYGRRIHIMLEIKEASHVSWRDQGRVLGEVLHSLRPGRDYHILGLDLPSLWALDGVPARFRLPIARFDIPGFSREVQRRNYSGLCGHYLLISQRRAAGFQRRGQGVGVGFVDSWPVLCWVAARNPTWIFSNRAVALETRRRTLLAAKGCI